MFLRTTFFLGTLLYHPPLKKFQVPPYYFFCAKNGRPHPQVRRFFKIVISSHRGNLIQRCLKIVVTCCVGNSNAAAALGIQIWYLQHIFYCCECHMVRIILATLPVVFSAVSNFLQVRLYSTFLASLSQLFPFLTIITWHRHSSDEAKLYEVCAGCRCRRNIYENIVS